MLTPIEVKDSPKKGARNIQKSQNGDLCHEKCLISVIWHHDTLQTETLPSRPMNPLFPQVLVLSWLHVRHTGGNPHQSRWEGTGDNEIQLKERLLSYYDPHEAFYQFPPFAQGSPLVMAVPDDDSTRNNIPRMRRVKLHSLFPRLFVVLVL